MYEEKLQKLGLTSGEARVYTSLVELGSSKVGPIVKKSKVAYSKIYDVLDRLISKGLVSHSIKEKTKYFKAIEPIRLHEYLEKKEQELKQTKKHLDEMIPFLNKLSNNNNEHEVEIFLGNKGILTAYDLLLKECSKDDTIRFFYSYDPKHGKQIFDFYFRSGMFFKKLEENYKKKNISWKGIINRKDGKYNAVYNDSRFMNQKISPFPIPGNIDIGKETIIITAWSKNPIAILIKSVEVADNFRAYFDSLWNFLEVRK